MTTRTLSGGADIIAQVAILWRRSLLALHRLSVAERLFIALTALAYCYFIQPVNTNTISRYDMVFALAHGSAIIDSHHSNTIDISYYHGHYYSPRSVGLSLLAVPALEWLRLTDPTTEHWRLLTLHIAFLNSWTNLPVALLGALVFWRLSALLRPTLAHTPALLVVVSAFALATLYLPFATVFFSHTFAAALALTSFYLLYRARMAPRPTPLIALAGLVMGATIISEYQTALIMLALLGYIWAVFPHQRMRALLAFALAMTPCALVLGCYNWFAFGNPLALSYGFVAGSQFAGQHTGFFGVNLPTLDGLRQILLYPRGLLIESPFLLFIPLGFVRWLRSGQRPPAEALLCLAISVIYPLFVSSYFLPMAGENLPGPRLLIPMLPFSCLALLWVIDDARRWLRALFAALLAVGVASTTLYLATGVRIYHTYGAYPLTDLYQPILMTGSVPHRDGATPLNLLTWYLGAPQGPSLWLFLAPMLAWVAYLAYTLWQPPPTPERDTRIPPASPSASAPLLTPRPLRAIPRRRLRVTRL